MTWVGIIVGLMVAPILTLQFNMRTYPRQKEGSEENIMDQFDPTEYFKEKVGTDDGSFVLCFGPLGFGLLMLFIAGLCEMVNADLNLVTEGEDFAQALWISAAVFGGIAFLIPCCIGILQANQLEDIEYLIDAFKMSLLACLPGGFERFDINSDNVAKNQLRLTWGCFIVGLILLLFWLMARYKFAHVFFIVVLIILVIITTLIGWGLSVTLYSSFNSNTRAIEPSSHLTRTKVFVGIVRIASIIGCIGCLAFTTTNTLYNDVDSRNRVTCNIMWCNVGGAAVTGVLIFLAVKVDVSVGFWLDYFIVACALLLLGEKEINW